MTREPADAAARRNPDRAARRRSAAWSVAGAMHRALVLVPLLALLACAGRGPPLTEVIYAGGGRVSGPYRVAADLAGGTVSEAEAPSGVRGDAPARAAGINAWTMPETSRRVLSPAERDEIARLALLVRRDGASRPRTCIPTMSALGVLRVVAPGEVWERSFSLTCLTPDAEALIRALTCAANPERQGCG